MLPGDLWAYRARESAPSECVRVREIRRRGRSDRVEIEFLDGENAGQVLDVPRKRLRVAWAEVDAYDQLVSNWERISGYELTDAESDAVEQVFELLIPDGVAAWSWKPVRYACVIRGWQELERITRRDCAGLLDGVDSFEHEDALWTSPLGTVRIAEAVAHANAIPVLASIHEHERECRERSARGRAPSGNGDDAGTTAEWEYENYLAHHRPVHELLRQWCGHRAVTFHERLMAAEQEIQRLDDLLAYTLDALRGTTGAVSVPHLEEIHHRDRITPYNIRPVIERPLCPTEIPVEVVYRHAWWTR